MTSAGLWQVYQPRDVMLAFPHPGTVKTEFMLSVFDACAHPGTRVGEVRDFRTGPAMAQARNHITRIFLDSPLTWLWMVDSDMLFSGATLGALLASAEQGRPVTGALCFVQLGPEPGEQAPTMYQAIRDEEGRFIFKSMERFPLGEPVQVGATGAGCLLIHRDVFSELVKADPACDGLWWADITVDGCLFGEDFSFCMRCARAGIGVWVDTSVQVAHTKSMVIGAVSP